MKTFIDLFAGIGGIRKGFEDAGAKCIFSSENDKFAVKTYEHIFGEKPYGDITKIDISSIPSHDILCAGFPCQPFSCAGVSKYMSMGLPHGFEHPTKGTMFFHVVNILQHKKPKAIFLENVKNLLYHDNRKTWNIIKKSLEDIGYDVWYNVINASLVLPQKRERIFIIGLRKDLHIDFQFPEIKKKNIVLKDILDKNVSEKYTLSDKLWQGLQRHALRHLAKGNGFGFRLVDVNDVAPTLTARYGKDGGGILIPQEGKNPRRLTPAECARLQGFPAAWQTPVVSDTQAYRQFGNSVPVPVVTCLAKHLLTYF